MLLQWKDVTANSCEVGGYDSYDWPTTGEWRQAGSNLAQCDMSGEKYGSSRLAQVLRGQEAG